MSRLRRPCMNLWSKQTKAQAGRRSQHVHQLSTKTTMTCCWYTCMTGCASPNYLQATGVSGVTIGVPGLCYCWTLQSRYAVMAEVRLPDTDMASASCHPACPPYLMHWGRCSNALYTCVAATTADMVLML